MSTRTTPKIARTLLRKGLKEDAELTKDLSALFSFAAAAANPTPLGIVAAFGLLLETTGSIVSASVNLLGRFRRDDGLPADSLAPYERFNTLFFLTTIRAYMQALDGIITTELAKLQAGEAKDIDGQAQAARATDVGEADRRMALQEVQARARDVNDADLTYLFAVEPLTDEVPLLAALRDWLIAH